MVKSPKSKNAKNADDSNDLANKFPLKLLEIVITAVVISTFITMIYELKGMDYNVVTFPLVCLPIYFPILYSFWIYRTSFINQKYLSDKRMRFALYLTAIFAFFSTLAQIQEFDLFLDEKFILSEFISVYSNKTALHPFFCILIILMFIYVHFYILREKRDLFLYFNIILIILFLRPVSKNYQDILSALLPLIGIHEGDVSYLSLIIICLVVFTFILSRLNLIKKSKKDSKKG